MTITELHDGEPFDDDKPVGRILSRRQMLVLLGGLGATLLVGCGDNSATATPQALATTTAVPAEGATAAAATPLAASPTAAAVVADTCVVKPEMTEGPYFVDENLNRSDIRADSSSGTVQAGLPLALTFMVSQLASNACVPLKDAKVDIWHCNALGVYSDTSDANWGSTVGQNFLRGYQSTDANGVAAFTTIYPGWYSGRAVHIHFKIRTTGSDGNAYEFTSQLFFDDTLSDQVFTQAPYSQKTATRDTLNSTDSIYSGGGDQTLLTLTRSADGYSTAFNIALDLSDTQAGASDSASGGGGAPGGGGPGGGGPGGTPPGGFTGTPPAGGPGGQRPGATATPTS